jgi:AraC family transcriptional regulator, regulatory protein of adaptative response / methylated-DNA-[protein]-cysteine methyltransferase
MPSVDLIQSSQDYRRVERAIGYLAAHYRRQPSLAEVAAEVGLSEFHFQRLFGRWVGITPKRFLQFLTKEHAKSLLAAGAGSVLDAAYDSGLSGPGRLHDLFVHCEAVTPGEYRRQGAGLEVSYGFAASPFGECLLAATERGVCHLAFVDGDGRDGAVAVLEGEWGRARLVSQPRRVAPLAAAIFAATSDWRAGASHPDARPLHLVLKGTNFQIKVWEALLRIPAGAAVSYQDLARHLGMPAAARAVGNAVGANPVPFVIPCHRVLRKAGDFGGYRYGTARKQAILAWESAALERLAS